MNLCFPLFNPQSIPWLPRVPLLLAALLWAPAASSHEVEALLSDQSIRVVTLRYADGAPFAYEQYQVTEEGGTTPVQTGRTDAQGRSAILPVAGKTLIFSAASADGHGAVVRIAPVAGADSAAPPPAPAMSRWLLVLSGAAMLFGLFGLLQLFITRRNASRR